MMVSDDAKNKILEYLKVYKDKTQQNDIFFRVDVLPKNCHKYKMGFDNIVKDSDEVYDFDGFKIRLDKYSSEQLLYATLDFINKDGKFGFNINNPKERECTLHSKKGDINV
jgi:iron-sulfur cluster assembly protein